MQKHIFISFFILINSIYCVAQGSESMLKNNVGLGLLYNDRTDIKLDLRYERLLRSKHLLGFSAFTNFSSATGFKTGYKFMVYDQSRFQILAGLDYHFERFRVLQFPNETFKATTFEIPIEVRCNIKNELKIYLGVAAGWSLNNRKDENFFINNVKFGLLQGF